MGLFTKSAPVGAVEAFAQSEERYAAGLHEDFDTALTLLKNVKYRARDRAAELRRLSHGAKERAHYLEETFGDE